MIGIEGTIIDLRSNSYNFIQIIFDPTHILPNSFSYIDFILQTNLTWLLKLGLIFPYIQSVTIALFL